MAVSDIQTSFAAGELSPQLYARVDLAKFQVGAAMLRNFFVDYRGGVSNRAGTQYIDKTSQGARLIPFIVSTQAAYVLVFTDQLITIYNLGVLVTTVAVPYRTADLFAIQYTQSADVLTLVHPSYPPADLSRTSDTTFSYAAIQTGPDIQPPTITTMRAPHSQDYMYGYVVTAVDADGKEESLASNNGVRLSLILNEGINQVIGLTWTPPAQPVSRYNVYKWGGNDLQTMVASTTWGFVGTSLTTTFTDTNIAPDFSKQPPGWGDPFSGGQFQSISVNNGGAGYSTTGQFPNIPYVPLTITGDGTGAAGFAVLDNATGKIVGVYLTNPGKNYTNATVTAVGQGGTGATFNYTFSAITPLYPAATAYLQQRRVFGGSTLKPETIVMSQPGLITNFNTTPVQLATDALVMSIAAEEVNTIRSFVQVAYGLIAFTTGGSFLINGGTPGAAINANSPSIQPQVSQGANNLLPLRINYDVLYGQAKGNRIHNLTFAWQKQSYTGTDVSTLAAHLFDNFLTVDWAYAEEPFKIVWAVRSDGHLLSLTYVPEQDVYAWTRHDTQGLFKSVCSVPEGNFDAVYVVVERYVPGLADPGGNWVYYLERLHERQGCCIYDAWFLDCALSLTNPTLTSPLYVTPTGPTTVAIQTYAPGAAPSGNFGPATFAPITGLLGLDTSSGGDGNGVAIPDWDRGVLFTSSAASGACAKWDLTTTTFTPTRFAFHANNAVQGLSAGAVDSAGNIYLAAPSALVRVAADLQTNSIVNFAALGAMAVPNQWFASTIAARDYLFSVGGGELDVLDIHLAAPTFLGKAAIAPETNAEVHGRINSNTCWVIGTWGQSAAVYRRQAQPFGLFKATVTPGAGTPVALTRVRDITPAMFGFNHFTSSLDLLGDETDGNPIIWMQCNPLTANWSGATTYAQYDLVVSGGHDFESLSGGNTNNLPVAGGTGFWRDLGVHDAVGGQKVIKVNAATGAVMWTVTAKGNLLGYRPMSRIRHGQMRLLDVVANSGSNRWLWDIDTITGAGSTTPRQLDTVNPSFNKQFYNDATGQWLAGVTYAFTGSATSPHNVGATPANWSGWAELGAWPAFVFPPGGMPNIIGSVIQIECGKATITAQTDTTHVTATVISPFDDLVIPDDPNGLLAPVDAGNWTITKPARVVTGLGHLEGKQVWALADGVVVGPLTVAGGSVDVGFLASSIVVGLKYTSQIQTLYLTTDGIQQGSDQGKRKQISGITLRVDCTRGLSAGTDFGQYLTPVPELNAAGSIDLFTGDCRVLSYPQWDERGFTMVEQDLPLPATVLGIVVEVTPGDDAS